MNQQMNNDVLVQADQISKKFCKTIKHVMLYGSADIAKDFLGIQSKTDRLRNGEFWAIEDVSFTLKKGETLGIIGVNGSGKSTVLRMINGIFMPDKGRIEVNGRVGALIAVGAGFHPMLTGRENVYVNGQILGMTKKEVDQKINDIIAFAEIGDFIDAPVKHYSSGMFVRLGFSVAIHCDPEILLIDEVLAVGDLSFRNKCLRYMAALRQKARGIIFISHNLEQVRVLCDRVIIIDKGKMVYQGETHKGCVQYEEKTRQIRINSLKSESKGKTLADRITSGEEINFKRLAIINQDNQVTDQIAMHEPLKIICEFEVQKQIPSLYFSVSIHSDDMENKNCIWVVSNDDQKAGFNQVSPGVYQLAVTILQHNLAPKVYIPNVAIRNNATGETYERLLSNCPFKVTTDGSCLERGFIHVNEKWDLVKMDQSNQQAIIEFNQSGQSIH